MKTKKLLTLLLAASLALGAGHASAHDMWLMVEGGAPGKPLAITAAYGHAFPAGDEPVAEKDLEGPVVSGPKGQLAVKPAEGGRFLTAAAVGQGSYVITAVRKGQFWSHTPGGWQNVPKSQAPEAVESIFSAKYAKAVVNVGQAKGDVSKPAGLLLEIVPLANPAALKPGAELPVLVLFQGKPLGGAKVTATHEGSVSAHAAADSTVTDSAGKARVRLAGPGLWMLAASHETPYKNPAECDKCTHAASLTFNLK